MIFKEENIFLPMAQQTLTEDEWAEIWAVSPRYGWCLVEPQQGYQPTQNCPAATPAIPADGTIMMPTGHVTVEQLTAVLSTLPLDLTFVDAEDRVAFFAVSSYTSATLPFAIANEITSGSWSYRRI